MLGYNSSPSRSSSHSGGSQDSGTSIESASSLGSLKMIIAQKITIDEEMKRQNKQIIESFRAAVISELKSRSPLFNDLYQNTYHTGSSYEGLRISDPNEFDIDVVLNFPFRSDVGKLEPVRRKCGFAAYMLTSDWIKRCCHDRNLQQLYLDINRYFVENNCIMPAKVRSWMQSIIDTVNVQRLSIANVNRIIVSQSGPAKTFKLVSRFQGRPYEISVDLVPVIQLKFEDIPDSFDRSVVTRFNVPHHLQFFFLVPKEYKGSLCNHDSVIAKRLWRLHFPGIEKHIIHNRGCVKPVVKLLKLLRDEQRWSVLSSYSLKTVVLRMFLDNPGLDHWQETNMTLRFMEALRQLSHGLSRKEIRHVFFEDNLLENIDERTVHNINNRLQRIVAELEADFPLRIGIYLN